MINHMKRTTLLLNEHCLVELKKIAASERRTLSDVIDELLRAGIADRRARRERKPRIELPSFAMGRPRINIADRDRLEEDMD